jgi:hypothetical protein
MVISTRKEPRLAAVQLFQITEITTIKHSAPSNPHEMNTCKTVSKQRTLTPLE